MRRALELARRGAGHVAPNPMVGCVVVHEGRVLGEGFHARFGGPHAEVEALHQVTRRDLLPTATVYVTLEPCAHYGKTPPCADLLLREGVRRVVIANVDPNPLVGGQGLARLRAGGVEVVTGVLQAAAAQLNRRFFTRITEQRPYVVLKWAQTADGYLARADGSSRWISGALSRRWVHRWRTEEAAILVGAGTAVTDNPRLTARDWEGPSPLRVVIDRRGQLPDALHLLDGTVPTRCYTTAPQPADRPGVTYVALREGTPVVQQVLTDLHAAGVASLFVEGGARTLRTFFDAALWDEARVFTAPKTFGDGLPAPRPRGQLRREVAVGDDRLQWWVRDPPAETF